MSSDTREVRGGTPATATVGAATAVPCGVPPQRLDAAVAALRDAEAATARAVLGLGELAGSGECEALEGLPLVQYLQVALQLPHADARMLVSAGKVLAVMPVLRGLFCEHRVSWGQVRAIVVEARGLGERDRRGLDARIAATVQQWDGIDAFVGDRLIEAVQVAVNELRDARRRDREDPRRRQGPFCGLQADLFGGITFFGAVPDPVAAATVVNALHDRAKANRNRDGDHGPPLGGAALGKALVQLCGDALAGTTGGDGGAGGRRPAKPLVVVHVDADAARNAGGIVELGVSGPLSRIPQARLAELAADADVQAVIFDGARPLATSKTVHARRVTTKTRTAVHARDLGDRFPGSRAPLAGAHLHHLTPQATHRSHHPDGLVTLSPTSHRITHRHRWKLHLDPHTGLLTITRGNKRWRSVPRGTPLSPPRGDPDHPNHPNHPKATSGDSPHDPTLPF